MKLCIDPGHGMSNRSAGVYDPGCERDEITEADLVLTWALELEKQCKLAGVETWMTRRDATTPALLRDRVKRASAAGCTHILSLHVNDADNPKANGIETLYRTPSSGALAKIVQMLALQHLGLKDRGVKRRTDLAILNHPQAVLLELGFIGSSSDLAHMECRCCRINLCRALAEAVKVMRDEG